MIIIASIARYVGTCGPNSAAWKIGPARAMLEGKERIGVERIWSGSVAVYERLAAPPYGPSRCGVVSLRLVVIPLLPQCFHHRDTPSPICQEPLLVMSIHDKPALRYKTENPRNETLSQHMDKERSRLLSLPAEVRDAI